LVDRNTFNYNKHILYGGNMTTQTGNTDQGWLASLRQRIEAMLAGPRRLWAGFTGRLWNTWRFVNANKMRLFLTIMLVATVIGTAMAIYLWRREIADLLAAVINGAIVRIRGSHSFRPDGDTVVIGQSVAADGVKRTVRRAMDPAATLRE
jgi:hypothetical protein